MRAGGRAAGPVESRGTQRRKRYRVVVGTLQQIKNDNFTQTCTGTIDPGVANHASVEFQKTTGDDGLWVLDCG